MLRGRVGQSSFEGLSLYVLVGLVVLVVVGLVGFSLFSRVGDVGVESSCVTGVSFLQCSDVVATDRGVVLRLSSLQKNFFVDEVMVFESGVGGAVCVLDAVDSPLFVEGHTSLEVVVPCSPLLAEGVHAFEVVFVFFEPGDVLRDRLVAQAKVEVVVADERLVGGACVGGRCAFGLSCDVVSDTCKVGVGGSCAGGLSNQCVSGTTCRGSPAVCEVGAAFGGSCAVTDDCVSGAACEGGECKVAVGGSCAVTDDCVSGTSCGLGANSVCVLDGSVVVGGQCNSDVQCVANGICDVNVCKVRVGASCSVNQCVSGATCQGNPAVCKAGVGGSCTATTDCVSGTSCGLGANSVCVLDGSVVVGGQCNSDVQCVANGICDVNVCKVRIGASCSANQCVSGADCRGSPAVCKVVVALGGVCGTDADYCVSGTSCGVGRVCVGDGSLSMDVACDDSRQCGSGLSCARTTNINLCKKSVGVSCTESTECVIGLCDDGVCAGKIITFAGTGVGGSGGENVDAKITPLNNPRNVAVDSLDNVYINDNGNQRVRKVTPGGIISTLAGTGMAGSMGDDGPAKLARLSNPAGVAVDSVGNVYITDSGNGRVRKVTTPGGIISTFFGGLTGPTDVAVYTADTTDDNTAGDVYIAVWSDNSVRVLHKTGTLNRMIGGWSGPHGVAVDDAGNVYVAEWTAHRVSKAIPSGSTPVVFAGTGSAGFGGDGGVATSAQLSSPGGVAVDTAGNVYIADYGNHRVRVVNKATGYISTLAGTGMAGSMGDGGAAKLAQLNHPLGVAVDSVGNVYIADAGNHRVRVVLVE